MGLLLLKHAACSELGDPTSAAYPLGAGAGRHFAPGNPGSGTVSIVGLNSDIHLLGMFFKFTASPWLKYAGEPGCCRYLIPFSYNPGNIYAIPTKTSPKVLHFYPNTKTGWHVYTLNTISALF
ncbi:MAG: hypothetical protein P4L50_16030 [Anaerolineaceae bacterium]|nr:hypothetical protein [Anaerolineaceae bacterium]